MALNMTVPSLFRGMFMETRRWRGREAKLVTRTRRATTAETELSAGLGGRAHSPCPWEVLDTRSERIWALS